MGDAAKDSLADLLRDLQEWEVTLSLAKQADDQSKDPLPANLKGLPSYQVDYGGFQYHYVRQAMEFRNSAANIFRQIDAKPGVEQLKTLCIGEGDEFTAAVLQKLCARAARNTGKTLDDVLSLPIVPGLKLLDHYATSKAGTPSRAAPPKQGEGNGGTDSPPKNRSRKGVGGRKPVAGAEETKRLDLLREWWKAQEAGVKQKDFCTGKGIKVGTLQRYVNWHATRKTRNTN